MDRAAKLSLNKGLQVGLHVDSPLKQMLVFTPRLEARLTRFQVTGCPNKLVFRLEDRPSDSGCRIKCSNWRLNEFTELPGRR